MEQRHARQEEEAKERERVEQEQRELEVLEMEVAEGLLMMNMPTSVATQTEVKTTVESYQQTETHTKSVQAQTEATGNLGLEPAGVQMSNAISAESLKENDDMTRFYTGFTQVVQVVTRCSDIFAAFTIYYSLTYKADPTR